MNKSQVLKDQTPEQRTNTEGPVILEPEQFYTEGFSPLDLELGANVQVGYTGRLHLRQSGSIGSEG